MKKITNNKSLMLLIFLGLFGFSVGLFDNYRELWLNANNITTKSISHIISISSFITVLILFFFTLKVTASKLKDSLTIALVLKLITSTILVCLNNTNNFFFIKFFMFFDIAFNELILSSIYPLMLKLSNDDDLYTKKDAVESLFNKLGFLLVSIFLGRTICHTIIDYNICLLLSIIFVFLSFIVLLKLDIENKKSEKALSIKASITYFNKNKVLYLFLITNIIASITWEAIVGMPLLTLTSKLNINTNVASFIILISGILTSIMSLIIAKYLKSKNDYINLFFKYGIRIFLYLGIFITNNKNVMLISLIILLITDSTYGFLFNGYFINSVKEEYTLLLVVLKYCTSLIGRGIGIFICGLVFNLEIRYLALPSLIIAIFHYYLASILVSKKHYKLV